MTRYTTTVEAFQLPPPKDDDGSFMEWARQVGFTDWESGEECITMYMRGPYSEGFWVDVVPGDWIVMVAPGIFSIVKPEAFEQNFKIEA